MCLRQTCTNMSRNAYSSPGYETLAMTQMSIAGKLNEQIVVYCT